MTPIDFGDPPTLEEFLADEQPYDESVKELDKTMSRFSSTTRVLLAMARWYELEGEIEPDDKTLGSNARSAELIRTFAHEFADHLGGPRRASPRARLESAPGVEPRARRRARRCRRVAAARSESEPCLHARALRRRTGGCDPARRSPRGAIMISPYRVRAHRALIAAAALRILAESIRASRLPEVIAADRLEAALALERLGEACPKHGGSGIEASEYAGYLRGSEERSAEEVEQWAATYERWAQGFARYWGKQ